MLTGECACLADCLKANFVLYPVWKAWNKNPWWSVRYKEAESGVPELQIVVNRNITTHTFYIFHFPQCLLMAADGEGIGLNGFFPDPPSSFLCKTDNFLFFLNQIFRRSSVNHKNRP